MPDPELGRLKRGAGLIKLESRINETLSDQDRHSFGDPCCH